MTPMPVPDSSERPEYPEAVARVRPQQHRHTSWRRTVGRGPSPPAVRHATPPEPRRWHHGRGPEARTSSGGLLPEALCLKPCKAGASLPSRTLVASMVSGSYSCRLLFMTRTTSGQRPSPIARSDVAHRQRRPALARRLVARRACPGHLQLALRGRVVGEVIGLKLDVGCLHGFLKLLRHAGQAFLHRLNRGNRVAARVNAARRGTSALPLLISSAICWPPPSAAAPAKRPRLRRPEAAGAARPGYQQWRQRSWPPVATGSLDRLLLLHCHSALDLAGAIVTLVAMCSLACIAISSAHLRQVVDGPAS